MTSTGYQSMLSLPECSRAIDRVKYARLMIPNVGLHKVLRVFLVAVLVLCLLNLDSTIAEDTNAITAAAIARDLGFKGSNTVFCWH